MTPKTLTLSDNSQIPWIAFGTGTVFNRKSCKDACSMVLSLGFTHIDTATRYGNDEDVGEAIASSGLPRESLYVTTKLDVIPPDGRVEGNLRNSLKKLRLEYVDLYLIHAPILFLQRAGGLKQVWREMVEVKEKGLTRSIGVSNFSKKFLEEIIELGLEKPVVNQMEYHVFVAKRLEPLLSLSQKHGIRIAAWGSLRPLFPDRTNDASILPACVQLKFVLDSIAKARGDSVTPNQILFKWLEAKGTIAVTTSTKDWRLKEYLETDNLSDLSQEEIDKIEQSTGGVHYRFEKLGSFIDECYKPVLVLAMPVKTIPLSDGAQIPWIAFGTGTAFFQKSCKDACALALSLGFTHIDTAAMYKNEEDVGDAIASSGVPRESLYVTTKLDAIPPGGTVEGNLRDSLKKLQLEYVDLYLVHAPYLVRDRPGGMKQAWLEMVDVKKKGLARSIGVSNFNVKDLEGVIELGLEKPVVNQIEYHLLVSSHLEPLLSYCKKHSIIVASWGSLRPLFPDPDKHSAILLICAQIKSILESIARARGEAATPNQLMFKWIESKNMIAVTTSAKEWRLKEYLDAENIPDLSENEINAIDQSGEGTHYRFSRRAYADEN
ncbi:hypothetical protein ACEPAF_5339 [Sanghuangporus sanghuang]